MSDLYQLLGVPRTASHSEIQFALDRRLAEAGNGDEAKAQLRAAAETLSDPVLRAAYDAGLEPEHAPGEPVRPPTHQHHRSHNPLDRLTQRLPRPWRVAVDWVVTIAGAIAIVLAIKAWIVNPYRIPSSSMEPTLHCAKPDPGCIGGSADRVLANRFIYHFEQPHRGDVIVFNTPPLAQQRCGQGGVFVKRLIGLPGEVWAEKRGYVYINGKKLNEPYVQKSRRDLETLPPRRIPPGYYFFMGDNRNQSCDSRMWGPVPRKNLIGEVFAIYWPLSRISFR